MKPAIRRARPQDEYFFAEGCYILELSNSADDPGARNGQARVPPLSLIHI